MLKKQICKMQFNKDIKQDKEICVLIFKDVNLLRIKFQMDISIHRQIASLEITTVMIFFFAKLLRNSIKCPIPGLHLPT